MTIKDFVIEAKKALSKYLEENELGGITFRTSEVVKANDERLHGFTFIQEGIGYGVTQYLDPFYHMYEEGMDPEDAINEFINLCMVSVQMQAPQGLITGDMTFEKVRSRLSVRLLDARSNKSYVDRKPYIDAGCGLVLIVYVNSEESVASEWKIAVTDDILKLMGCSRETLLAEALNNTMRLERPVLCRLRAMVTEDMPLNYVEEGRTYLDVTGRECCEPMVLTNTSSIYGASVLFYPDMMEKTAEIIGGGYYIIPSSVHEVILIPDLMDNNLFKMQRMLLEGNLETVERGDFLSGVVFHYNPGDNKISIATPELVNRVHDSRKAS